MKYLEEKMPTIDGYPSKYFPFEKLVYHTGSLLPAFDRQQQYDLTEMEDILTLPRQVFSKLLAKTSVGAAIRISKVIGKENHAEAINKIVRDSFTPEEHPDLNDKYRIAFCAEEEFA